MSGFAVRPRSILLDRSIGFPVPALVALGALSVALGLFVLTPRQTADKEIKQLEQRAAHLEERNAALASGIRFTHDLVILCSYDRHLCLGGATQPSKLVARILRQAGLDPAEVPVRD